MIKVLFYVLFTNVIYNNKMKRILKIKTYKVPIIRDDNGKIMEVPIDLTKCKLLNTEEKEIEDIQVEIPEITQKIANANRLTKKMAEVDTEKDYITMKFLTK